jgi:centromere protein J
VGNNGKIITVYESGRKEIKFCNGVRKEVFPDGYMIVYFNNKDVKQTFPDEEKIVYYFAEANTTQTTFKTGFKAFRFGNG